MKKNFSGNMQTLTQKVMLCILIVVLSTVFLIPFISAAPSGPTISYVSNSTFVGGSSNRSQDAKGTITVVTMSLNQQDYKWKAYVGNVTGGLTLDDANAKSIYDWSLSSIAGEIYATRASSAINWANVSCVTQGIIDTEQTAMGMTSALSDSINATFRYNAHRSFLIGTKNITASSCRSTATYVNDAAQTVNEAAKFQEVLLRDEVTSNFIYATLIDNDQQSYDGVSTYDFQMLVAENESSTTPTTYYFYAELG